MTAADYDSYCVTAPADPRLPQGGGYQICGLYDLKPASFGQVRDLVTLAENFGQPSQIYNGLRVTSNARFTNGALLAAGVSVGRMVTDNCFQNALPDVAAQAFGAAPPAGTVVPRTDAFCHVTPPLGKNWQFKMNGLYPLPWWGIQTSATFRVVEGAVIDAFRTYTNAEIARSLGRNLAACRGAAVCTATVVVPLYAAGATEYEPRLVMLDWRFSKNVQLGSMRLQGLIDLFNFLNANAALLVSNSYDARWPRPTSTSPGRTIRLGAKVNW